MEILIVRQWFTNRSSMGLLSIDGTYTCFTLEDVARAEGVKISKETCISPGEYDVIMDYSPRHKKIMPHILNVPMFEGIRFDIANSPDEVEGCIALGFEKYHDLVGSSYAANELVVSKINLAFTNNEPIKLIIKNQPL